MPKMKKCPVCGISIKLENLEKHLKRVHPKEKVEVDYSEKEEKVLKDYKIKKKELERPTGLWKIGAVIAVIAVIIITAVMLVPAQEPIPPPPPPGSPAPTFELRDINGNLISIDGLKGEVIYLDLFQTTCSYCAANTQSTLSQIYGDYGDKIKMISIDISTADTVEAVLKFKSDNGNPQWQYAIDTAGAGANGESVWDLYKYIVTPQGNTPGTPSSVLIDRDGNYVYANAGVDTYAELAAQIDAIL